MKHTFKNYWVYIQDGNPLLSTIAYSRKSSKERLLKNSKLTWTEVKSFGWMCNKINIELTEIK